MKPIGIGILGAGWWATECHLPEIGRHPDASVLVVQRRDLDICRKIALDFGVPRAVATIEEALETPGLDAVVVASTPNIHYQQARAALERGLHVLIEKPMTLTLDESEQLVALAAERDRHFLVSCPFHYAQNSLVLRQILRERRLGDIHLIQVHYTNFTRDLMVGRDFQEIFGSGLHAQIGGSNAVTPRPASYADPAVAGGGQIFCQMSHVAAHLGFLFDGEPWTELFARFDNAGTATDITNLVSMKMRDSGVCNLTCSGLPMLSARQYEIRIYGSCGMVIGEFYDGTLEWHDATPERHILSEAQPHAATYPMFAPVANLIDLVRGRGENGSPASLGVYAMKLIESAIASVQQGRNIIQ